MLSPNRWTCWLFSWILLSGLIVGPVLAQKMPPESVVDVPAIGAGLCVSNLFQTNMVLQRDKPVAVWGWAAPGEEVSVSFSGQQVTAQAGADRAWKVTFSPLAANSAPQTMSITGSSESLALENILVGDVWVLGGQSNMEFELAKVENGNLEIISANLPALRILTVPYEAGLELKLGFPRLHEYSSWFGRHFRKGDWDVCKPEVARELSAIGYVFARRIHQASQVPIGVIDASRGGTTVETWTPLPVLRSMNSDSVKAMLATRDQAVADWNPQADLESRIAQHRQWIDRQTKEGKPIPEDRKEEPSDLRPGPLGDHNFPGHCYAGMISPLAGLSVKGAIFHQGYNNAFEGSAGALRYREIFPEMIRAWRTTFGDPELPFGILSLCTDGNPQTRDDYCEKMLNAGIEIRAAQYATFLELYNAGDKHLGFVSTYGLRRRWYHPQLKVPAGERIARWALATEYGFNREIEWKPPMLISVERLEGALLLKLDTEVGDPEEGAIQGFAIASDDGKFHPADVAYFETGKNDRGQPQFDRKQLVLTSPMVAQPQHYRYAWGRNPLANLQAIGNKDIPFATQRSDDWTWEATYELLVGKPLPESGRLERGQIAELGKVLQREDIRRRRAEAEALLRALPAE